MRKVKRDAMMAGNGTLSAPMYCPAADDGERQEQG